VCVCVCVCVFVRLSEKQRFFFLCTIYCLFFITETVCVYWAVRTEYFNEIQVNPGFQRFVLALVLLLFALWPLHLHTITYVKGPWGGVVVKGAAPLVGRSRDRFPVLSLDFSVTYFFRPYHGPGVDSATSENEYQEHFLGVKAAGALG